MFNEFTRHEQAFRQWCTDGYPGAKLDTLDFIQHLTDPDDDARPRVGTLWRHQWDALLRTIYAYEVERNSLTLPNGILLNVVTGGGKTALIAATMAWLRLAHHVQRFLLLCPNLIVRDRLEEDFADGKVFVDRELIPPASGVAKDDFALTALGTDRPRGFANLLGANVILGNIHQFYQSNLAGQTNLAELMSGPNFVVFNDEAHNSPAPQWEEVLETMKPKTMLRVDTTATPDRADGQTPESNMIFEYGINDAITQRLVKAPVTYQPNINTVELTYRDADTGEVRSVEEIDWDEVEKANLSATQWVTDDKPMKQQMEIALARLREQRRRAHGPDGEPRYSPVLFVVAVSKLDARQAQRTLQNQFGINTLLVTEDSSDADRRKASELGRIKPRRGAKRYDAVVSVLMLREGWDVPEVGVILLLRKFSSKVYGQQVIGRGLRRVRLHTVSDDEPQICAVVDHPKLEHRWLWEIFSSKVRENVGIDDEFDESEDLPEPPPRQEVVDPSLIVQLPEESDESDDDEFNPEFPIEELNPIENWREVLGGLQYKTETAEITNQEIDTVESTELTGHGWRRFTAMDDVGRVANGMPIDIRREDLEDHVRSEIMQMAGRVLEERGYSSQFNGQMYRELLNHIRIKFLRGMSIGLAEHEHLVTAARMMEAVEKSVLAHRGLVEGMVEHGD